MANLPDWDLYRLPILTGNNSQVIRTSKLPAELWTVSGGTY